MAEKKTIERAKRSKLEGKSPSTQAGAFVHEEIEHIRKGKHGARSAKQAIAIGLSKARRASVPLKTPAKGSVSAKTHKSAASAYKKGQAHEPISKTRSTTGRKALKSEPTTTASRAALSQQTRTAAKSRTMASKTAAAKKAVTTRKAIKRTTAAKSRATANKTAAAKKAATTRKAVKHTTAAKTSTKARTQTKTRAKRIVSSNKKKGK